jgi:putative DNA primase/helicase
MFRNGLVEVMTEKKVEATPRLWMHSALDYDWNPKAECPGWLKFLGEVYPGDSESQDCTEEALGYSMTEDVSLQKGVLLVGKPRSGKGTIAAKVLLKLVGSTAFVSLNFHQWTATENSREDLIGKKAGVFPDVRLKPPKWYGQTLDPGGMDHKSTELVLAITSGDPVSVRRKYQVSAWNGVLPAKLWLVSNTVPNFNDPTLPSRFVKLAFGESWLGREDIGLAKRLEAEAEGIAVRCVRAYQRLVRRGRFIQPKAGLELERAVCGSSDPFTQFAKETFVLDYASEVTFTDAWIKFETWCEETGRADLRKMVTKRNFTDKLREVQGFEAVGRYKPHAEKRRITGVRWRRQAEREFE